MLETENGWSLFLDFVRTRCTKAEFANWIAPIRLVQATPDEVVLEVPNVFVQEYLLDNYRGPLAEFLPLKAGGELAITFVMAEAEKRAAPQEETEGPEDPVEVYSELKLNRHYLFDTFIEGPSNQFVKSAAIGVAMRPGKSYNPLFIHGGVGLGKTHLLHSIGHYVKEHQRKLKVQAITSEGFINDIIDALKNKSLDRLKRYYRGLDLLLVDDIQFLQNRLNFEEEFCNTFEALINQNKQIVITSDKHPSQLKLSERLVARMEWGLVASVMIPDLETRVAIIRQKAESKGLVIEQEVAFFIAEHVYSNVRQLEGAINRLIAHVRLSQVPLTISLVHSILAEMIRPSQVKKVTIDEILGAVSTLYQVKVVDLKGDSRLKEISEARQVAMYLAKELIDDSLKKIAESIGGRSHSTLLHAWKKVQEELGQNERLNQQIQLLRRQVS
jgi:chromosomal replication initiator protein